MNIIKVTSILALTFLTGCSKFVSEHSININHVITLRVERSAAELLKDYANATEHKAHEKKDIQNK